MKFAQSVRVGAWFLIGLNLLMALGSIWVFMRMAPAIEIIIDRNERSLQACEEMLSSLAMTRGNPVENSESEKLFSQALARAQSNITETDEPLAIRSITKGYHRAFQGDIIARKETVAGIIRLGEINRKAMIAADKKAKQFGNGGAWGIVFMAIGLFSVGIIFMHRLTRNLVTPLEEIYWVLHAHQSGDTMRRCTGADLPREITRIYAILNTFLDKSHTRMIHKPE